MQNDKALVIIDVQLGMFWEEPPLYRGEELLTQLKDLINRARAADVPVIYVQHSDSDESELLHPSKSGWQIHPEIAPLKDELVVGKLTPDSFYQTTLQKELEKRGIKKLILAGLQTEYCVDTTTRSAFSHNYDVTLVTDAHSTWGTEAISAKNIVAHHNRVLRSFASTKKAQEIEF